MMPIIICEDVEEQLNFIKTTIEEIIVEHQYDMQIAVATRRVKDVTDYIRSKKDTLPSIYFLDIELDSSINGYELGLRIREKDYDAFLTYITAHATSQYLTFSYKLECLDFIVKQDMDLIKRGLETNLEYINDIMTRQVGSSSLRNIIKLSYDGKIKYVPVQDILYAETHPNKDHHIIIHTESETIEIRMSLTKLKKMVGREMYRCHKSYLVSRGQVAEIDEEHRIVKLKNGAVCWVSIREWKGFMNWI